MAKSNSGKTRSFDGNASGKGRSSGGNVSAARLHQRSGSQSAFGGWEKVSRGDGTYRMRKTSR